MSKEVADLLRRARAKIATPKTWTQGALSRDALGEHIHPFSDRATCFCMTGATAAVAHSLEWNAADWSLENVIPGNSVEDSLEGFNDALTTTHADVLACFDRAIAAEESTP